MTEQVSSSDAGWDAWYDTHGAEHVALRKAVYRAGLPADAELFSLEENTLALVAQLSSRSPEASTVADVGCSSASWLYELQRRGHNGLLAGIEPNAGQFADRPYWSPKGSEQLQISNADPTEVLLVQSSAQAIPLPNKAFDITLMQLAMYHVPKPDQSSVIAELSRITKDDGAVVITTRGEKNKQTMSESRRNIALYLTRLMEEEIIPPANVNGDFTTEHGRIILPQHFRYVYELTNHADLVFDTPDKFSAIQAAQATFRGLYHTMHGEPLIFPWKNPIDTFYSERYELAFAQAEMGNLMNIDEQPITDSQDDAIFVCSNEQPLAALADLGYRPA